MPTYVTHLECSRCGAHEPADRPQTVCPKCAGSFYVRYDLGEVAKVLSPKILAARTDAACSMWKYQELMPSDAPVTLGEGQTPLLRVRRMGAAMGGERLYVKDEGLNPTGSFKARGLGCAVTMLKQFGVKKIAIPTAGNAGSALAAYAAQAGIEAHIFAPRDVPKGNLAEYNFYGANVKLVDGLISDCAKLVQQGREREGWYDVSTMKEPYRVEGKKTMGYEVVEQLGWQVPDVLFYPTGGGVGLIGMWKGFDELEQLGWIGAKRPRMVAVQAQGCAPVVRAFESGATQMEAFANAATMAAGLRVPKPYADKIILEILRASKGTALSVSDAEIQAAVRELAATEGIFAAPEGAAAVVAARRLYASGWLGPEETVVLYNTGGGLKYLDVLQ
ncbi:MAG TPA: threonine synthase [Terriglobales bacterium]|nr:threonine synthase [Terriglobales bacterium]